MSKQLNLFEFFKGTRQQIYYKHASLLILFTQTFDTHLPFFVMILLLAQDKEKYKKTKKISNIL